MGIEVIYYFFYEMFIKWLFIFRLRVDGDNVGSDYYGESDNSS